MRDNEKLLQALHDINANLTGIRNLMRHEGEMQHITRLHNVDWEQMLLSALGNIASSNKEINKPQEAMSECEETVCLVTIGEAKAALRIFCEKTDDDYEKLIMAWAADHLEKEAAPAPKAITWQEAVKVLADECAKQSGVDCALDKCPMLSWCKYARQVHTPTLWPLAIRSEEAVSDE